MWLVVSPPLAVERGQPVGGPPGDGEGRVQGVQTGLSVERETCQPQTCVERVCSGGGGGRRRGEREREEDIQTWVRVGPLGKPSNYSALSGQHEASVPGCVDVPEPAQQLQGHFDCHVQTI